MTAAPVAAAGEPSRRAPSFALLALLLNLLLLPFLLFGIHSGDSDAFYHLAGGRWMFEHGRVLDQETFSYTIPGRSWTNYYWGFEWLAYAAYRLAGMAGVLVLRDVLILATANLFLYWVWRRTGQAVPETLAFGLLVLPLYVPRALNVRPHLVSYLFLLVALVLLDALRRGRWRVAPPLVLLCALWANLHGVEYPVVLAAIAIHAADAFVARDGAARRWVGLLAACAAAFLANPFGAALFRTARIGADAEVMAQIDEMRPLALEELGGLFPALDLESPSFLHYAVLAGLVFVPGWVRRRAVVPLGLFALGLALIFNKRRFAAEFVILAVPYIADGLARARRSLSAPRRLPAAVLVGFAAWSAASAVATARVKIRGGNLDAVSASFYPVGAVRFLERHGLSGNLHTEPTIAGYATWALYPHVRTTMDMRTPEPFGAQELWLAGTIGRGVSLARVAERWPVDLVLVGRDTPLAGLLRSEPAGFSPVYEDPWFVVFAHERALGPGKEHLRLRTLSVMEDLEAGRIALGTRLDAAVEGPLRAEAERLREAWPANTLAQRALLWLMLSEGRFGEARERAAALSREMTRQALYPFFEGLALRPLGKPEDAVAAFRRAIDVAPEFLLPYPQAADLLLSLGRNQEALDLMERFTFGRWSRLTAVEYILLGQARQRTGRGEAARQAFERADWLLAAGDPLRAALERETVTPSGAAPSPR